MIAGFAAVEQVPVPRYLRSHRTGPATVGQYGVGAWRRWREAARLFYVCFLKVCAGFALAGLVVLVIGDSYYDHRAAQENLADLGDLPERIELFDSNGRFVSALS